MMAEIDRLYEDSRTRGSTFVWALFDHRYLLNLEQAAGHVSLCCGREVTTGELQALADRKWFKIRTNEDGLIGVPTYIPARIEMFLSLAIEGYRDQELEQFASYEDWHVEEILTANDLEYEDDDLESIILYLSNWIEDDGESFSASADMMEQIEQERRVGKRFLDDCLTWRETGVPQDKKLVVDRQAFRFRAVNDAIRIQLADSDRAKFRAGFSPTVRFMGFRMGFDESAGEVVWSPQADPEWSMSIRSALANDDSSLPLIRAKDFLLEGDSICTTHTMTPKEYEQRWAEHRLDKYLLAWADIHGQRRCLHCLDELPTNANSRKRFCSARCRNAEKSKRWRTNNPEGNFEAQRRYYKSLGDSE